MNCRKNVRCGWSIGHGRNSYQVAGGNVAYRRYCVEMARTHMAREKDESHISKGSYVGGPGLFVVRFPFRLRSAPAPKCLDHFAGFQHPMMEPLRHTNSIFRGYSCSVSCFYLNFLWGLVNMIWLHSTQLLLPQCTIQLIAPQTGDPQGTM